MYKKWSDKAELLWTLLQGQLLDQHAIAMFQNEILVP
jgi:hypothetical protein